MLVGSAGALWSLGATAKDDVGPLIGLLRLAPGDPTDAFVGGSLRPSMRKLGWEEGRNFRALILSADGGEDGLLRAAQELVARKVNLIIVFGDPAIRAAQAASATIPIVGMTDDILGSGLVASMARPGGNTTGVSIFASELDVKRFELLHEAVPRAASMGALADATTISTGASLERAARERGIKLSIFSVRERDEIGRALDALIAAEVDAVNVLASPLLWTERGRIIDQLNKAGKPAIYQWPDGAAEGGLLGYGPGPISFSYRLVASLTDKILRGAKPADLPIEQPTKFELAINLRTAKALGLTLPHSLLQRADEVIE
jgi:putative tryptophan/tyrosine transport system substrate-binding protein